MKRNSLTEADTLRPGQVLILPARASLHVLSSVTKEE
jgi:LysM repeat protein